MSVEEAFPPDGDLKKLRVESNSSFSGHSELDSESHLDQRY